VARRAALLPNNLSRLEDRMSKLSVTSIAFAICLLMGLSSLARADDKAADYTGTWKWTATMRNNPVDFTAKLKQDGDKVTGTVGGGQGGEMEIKDGKVENGELTFNVIRTRNGSEITTTYTGKLDGDTIKGKITSTGGTTRPARDWTATRAKEAAGDAK
jgi:hypothetical protein